MKTQPFNRLITRRIEGEFSASKIVRNSRLLQELRFSCKKFHSTGGDHDDDDDDDDLDGEQ